MNDNLILSYMDVTLRDRKESDIKDYIDWYTIKTDWQQWVAPWGGEFRSIKSLEKDLRESLEDPLPNIREHLEIEYHGHHVGWTNSYIIDGEADKLAVQIVLPEERHWNRGIGEKALICFIRYILEKDPYRDIFVEIWDGNKRMINLARSLGFEISPLERITKGKDKERFLVDRFKLTDENVSRYRI